MKVEWLDVDRTQAIVTEGRWWKKTRAHLTLKCDHLRSGWDRSRWYYTISDQEAGDRMQEVLNQARNWVGRGYEPLPVAKVVTKGGAK